MFLFCTEEDEADTGRRRAGRRGRVAAALMGIPEVISRDTVRS